MNIIITYMNAGSGHLAASNSLAEYIRSHNKQANVYVVDVLKEIDPIYNLVQCTGYLFLTKNFPNQWGKMYYRMQTERKLEQSQKKLQSLSPKFLKLIETYDADVVINCHYYFSSMCGLLKAQGKLANVRVGTIITDFTPSPFLEWTKNAAYLDAVFTANSDSHSFLMEHGVPKQIIHEVGIPVSEKFKEPVDRHNTLMQIGLKSEKLTVLLFAGGLYGLGGSENTLTAYECLLAEYPDINIITIAGKNKSMQSKFETLAHKYNRDSTTVVFGCISNADVAKYMQSSDLVISKCGGITTSEIQIASKPLLVVNPIKGQETENLEYLLSKEAVLDLTSEIQKGLSKVIEDVSYRQKITDNLAALARPNANEDICRILHVEEK